MASGSESAYADRPIIWILGGDRNIYSDGDRSVIEAMALGLRAGDGGRHLITFHPRGPSMSSAYFHTAKWLDFNMSQSSHAARDHDNGLFVAHDYALSPPKPTLDGEPRYERIPVGFYLKGADFNDRFDDYDVRQAAWWAVTAGACGHTYGNNSVWQMWSPKHRPVIGADVPWHEALDDPGAVQMGYVRRLFESHAFQKLRPSGKLIVDGPTSGGAKVRGLLAADGTLAFVYSPRGEPVHGRSGVSSGSRRCAPPGTTPGPASRASSTRATASPSRRSRHRRVGAATTGCWCWKRCGSAHSPAPCPWSQFSHAVIAGESRRRELSSALAFA